MTAANASRARRVFPARAFCKPGAEPTLEDILAGSVVRATMSADRVDADALMAMLRSVASRLRDRTRASRPASRFPAPARECALAVGRQAPAPAIGA